MDPAASATAEDYQAMIRRKAAAGLLLGATLFALVSIVSFNPYDLAENQWPPDSPLANWCGIFGARLAGWLLWWFGTAAFLVVLVGGVWSVAMFFAGRLREPWMKLFGSSLLVAGACSAAAMFGTLNSLTCSNGGAIGLYLKDTLLLYCGPLGAWIVIGIGGFFGLLFVGLDRMLAQQIAAAWAAVTGSVSRKVSAVGDAAGRSKSALGMKIAALGSMVAGVFRRKQAAETVMEEEPEAPPDEPACEPAESAEATPSAEDVEARAAERAQARRRLEEKVAQLTQIRPKRARLSQEAAGTAAMSDREDYDFPPLDLLEQTKPVDQPQREQHIRDTIATLEKTLADFGIEAQAVDIERGPVVTRYEMSLAPGIKVNRITGLSDDLAMAVKAPSVRVVAPIPGKSTVGIEVPNAIKEMVRLRELLESEEYRSRQWVLPMFLGRDASGKPIVSDLADMPHLLIAGATGSGKSVCINAFITSVMMVHHPDDAKLILVDPKIVELQAFDGIPHLITPVITDVKRATWILDWATRKMDERYDLLARASVRHITQYNELGIEGLRRRLGEDADYETIPTHLPYLILVIDEMADLMMTSSKEVEQSITRLAQKSRAVGIHLMVATQRPSVDVITGLIKANLPTRISFQVTARVDSRTILDRNGAEQLLGSGDMLFVPPHTSDLIRVQGTFVSDREMRRVVDHVTHGREADYALDINNWGGVETNEDMGERDELYDQALRIVLESQRGSVSLLQRQLGIGYTRAARLVDLMAAQGVVGTYKGSQAREVLYTLEEWLAMHPDTATAAQSEADAPPLEATTEVDDDDKEED